MKNKYKFSLMFILVLFVIVAIIGIGYYKYRDYLKANSAEVVIDEELSINYLDGKDFSIKGVEKTIKFSIINDGEDETMYHIVLTGVKTASKNATYTLIEDDITKISNIEFIDGTDLAILSFISIEPNETKSYELRVKNPDKLKLDFSIMVEKSSKENPNLAQTILNNNLVNRESKSKIGEEAAIVDEGIILDIDDNGNTYYFRGNVINNYVSFANKTWRIVRINGDGTVRLILDDQVMASGIYNSQLEKEKWKELNLYTNTNVYNVLIDWYKENLSDFDSYIATSKFCVDMSKEGEDLANYFRINLANSPTFNCLGTKNNIKIGLLTIDEVIYAGANINSNNQNYYLYNPNNKNAWWVMSSAKEGIEGIYYYEITKDGGVLSDSTGEKAKYLRPVINLNKDVKMVGTGSIDDPYKIE